MKIKDKNTLVLAISACLIVIAVIIAVVSFSVEKARVEKNTSAPVEDTQKADKPKNNKDDSQKKPDTTKPDTTAPQVNNDNIPGKYKVATKDDPLGVRLTPENEAERIYEIPKGSEIEVSATYDDWAYVEIDGVNGWVAKQYLELTEKGDAPKYANGKYVIGTQDDPLGIRTKPQDDAERNGEVPKGEKVTVLTVCGEWGYVEYDGKAGWLSFRYLKAE